MNKNEFISILKERFESNLHRHQNINWDSIKTELLSNKKLFDTVLKMENFHGEPDVVVIDNIVYYIDLSKVTPLNRRSLSYDLEALNSRKANKPVGDASSLASEIGIELLNEEEYRYLQTIEDFDLTTSSWIKTPDSFRNKKGALFGEKRYDQTFIYHNGAESYYSSRGFRGKVKIKELEK